MNESKKTKWNLADIACRAMQERDLLCEFSPQVMRQAEALEERKMTNDSAPYKDMRRHFWISIDNDDSLDLDQLTFAEIDQANTFIYVAIADVDNLVPKQSPIDQHALYNTTSVYTAPRNFPMIPPRLSTGLTSLNPQVERLAIVVKMQVDEKGEFSLCDLYPAWVINHAKLAYNGVAASLDSSHAYDPEVFQQITLQDQIAKKIKAFRDSLGALHFASVEVRPVVKNDQVVEIQPVVPNRANDLIENFMIAANVSMSRYMKDKNIPLIQRVVKTPEKWDKIVTYAKKFDHVLPDVPDPQALQQFLIRQQATHPDQFPDVSLAIIKLIGRGEYVALLPGRTGLGHFDLAQSDYAHTTAPNRRFPDLIMQRILKAHIFSQPLPYTNEELHTLAAHCTQKEDDATKVERRVRKSAIAVVLSNQIGKEFSALVTGASVKGTWVRITDPVVEGKLIRGFQGCNVGDSVQVRLIHVDVLNGFIDFARI